MNFVIVSTADSGKRKFQTGSYGYVLNTDPFFSVKQDFGAEPFKSKI
jgi:hypothetical protein